MDLFAVNQKSIYMRFLDFHIKNPRVYVLFEKFAFNLIERGRKKFGSKMIIERIRWEYYLEGKDERGFKINNDFTAYYSRLFRQHHPERAHHFEYRNIKN